MSTRQLPYMGPAKCRTRKCRASLPERRPTAQAYCRKCQLDEVAGVRASPFACYGVGMRAGQCGEERINDRYCAACLAVMAQWVREVRAA